MGLTRGHISFDDLRKIGPCTGQSDHGIKMELNCSKLWLNLEAPLPRCLLTCPKSNLLVFTYMFTCMEFLPSPHNINTKRIIFFSIKSWVWKNGKFIKHSIICFPNNFKRERGNNISFGLVLNIDWKKAKKLYAMLT